VNGFHASIRTRRRPATAESSRCGWHVNNNVEIAKAESLSEGEVSKTIDSFQKEDMPIGKKAAANHAVDFDQPVYNIWKQQNKTEGSSHHLTLLSTSDFSQSSGEVNPQQFGVLYNGGSSWQQQAGWTGMGLLRMSGERRYKS
jgi:hypothetical protein